MVLIPQFLQRIRPAAQPRPGPRHVLLKGVGADGPQAIDFAQVGNAYDNVRHEKQKAESRKQKWGKRKAEIGKVESFPKSRNGEGRRLKFTPDLCFPFSAFLWFD